MSTKRQRREVETTDFIKAARRFIAAAGRRAGQGDPEFELAALLSLQADLDAAIQNAINIGRQGDHLQGQKGWSWADIARGTGKTRQAAQNRWGQKAPQVEAQIEVQA